MSSEKKKKLILIDSNALIHRAYHALPPLSTKDGVLTNAVYGYALTLLGVLEKFKPEYLAAAFDLRGPTFRHQKFKDYKATRVKAPDELYQQIPLVKKMLKAFNVPIYEQKGFEADDVIGTITHQVKKQKDLEVIIVTGDLDTLQLINDQTKVFILRRGIKDTILYDEKTVKKHYHLTPGQMIDFKALRGDASDNIPGIKGVGEKTATNLLLKYQNLKGIYARLHQIEPPAVKKKLAEGKEIAFMSYNLARIRLNVPLNFNLKQCRIDQQDWQRVINFFKQIEFYSLAKRIEAKTEGYNEVSGHSHKNSTVDKINIKDIIDSRTIQALTHQASQEKRLAVSFSVWSKVDAEKCPVGLSADGKTGIALSLAELIKNKHFWRNKKIEKATYDFKQGIKYFRENWPKSNQFQPEDYFDVMLAAYLLKSGASNELNKLVLEEFGAELEHQAQSRGQASLLDGLKESEKQRKQQAEEAVWIWRLWDRYQRELGKISREQAIAQSNNQLFGTLEKVFWEIEIPLARVLAEMEMIGVKANKQKLQAVSKQTKSELEKLEKEIYQLAGEEFNVNSPSQLAVILYEKLQIPTIEIKKGKTGYSTDADQLRKIRRLHPIVAKIEEHRELAKLKNTYADALPELVEADGRIHTTFNQAVVATGRLSSSNPNLQNIPKRGALASLIRETFEAEKGYQLVSADYSQIDLRVAAHLSGDQRLIEIFQRGKDVHRATAAWVNNIPEEEVSEKQRSEAKSLNFGILYGMGLYGFIRDSGVSKERAEFFISQYMKNFPKLKEYLEKTKKFARQHGFVETEMGRRRYISNIKAANFKLKSAAERMAVNLPIQGLAADIMKLAMLALYREIQEQYDPTKVRMILQVHDELIFEVKKELVENFSKIAKKIMEGVYRLKVPLVVKVSQGKNWAEL